MNTSLDSNAMTVLAPFKLSAGAEALLDAVRNAWIIKHYELIWGGIARLTISAIPNMDRPILRVRAEGKNGGEIEPFFCVRSNGGKLTVTEFDEPNVLRCSTDPSVRAKAGPPC